jgi:L-ascorbate metabolism protein UlaG (beta-lactamase superfamily)
MKRILLFLISVTMTVSVFSQQSPQVDKLNTSIGDVEMYFIGHGSLMFAVNNFIIYVDPVRSSGNYDKMPKADLILVTHEHGDHLDTTLIRTLRKTGTVMYANANSAASVPWAQIMKQGDTRVVKPITVMAVPAYNIKNLDPSGRPYHPKGVGNGYVLTFGNKKIYVAGDTENIPEMKELKNIDVAFLPMNLPYTMTPEMTADAARSFKPAVLYPYHYGKTDPEELVRLLKDSGIEVRIRNLR